MKKAHNRRGRPPVTTSSKRGYTLPLKLTCKVTGKEVAYTDPEYIDKRIAEFGSLEALQKNFVSREGKRATTGLSSKIQIAVDSAKATIEKATTKANKVIAQALEHAQVNT